MLFTQIQSCLTFSLLFLLSSFSFRKGNWKLEVLKLPWPLLSQLKLVVLLLVNAKIFNFRLAFRVPQCCISSCFVHLTGWSSSRDIGKARTITSSFENNSFPKKSYSIYYGLVYANLTQYANKHAKNQFACCHPNFLFDM